jgi:hypothetical protein
LRSALAVVAGLIVTLVLVLVLDFLAARTMGIAPEGPPPALYLYLNLAGGSIAGMAGGATAMALAPHRPHGHVFALAVVILLLSLPTLFSAPTLGQPSWYGVAVSVLGPVAVLTGGVLEARHRERMGD